MKETPTPKDVRDFFQKEEQDWQLVKQASLNGDENATLALALLKLISIEIDSLWAEHEKFRLPEDPAKQSERTATCNLILERIGNLIKQRRAILYEDYGVLKNRMQIYVDTIQRQMTGHPILDIIIN